TKNFALYLINGVVAHLAEIDKIIRQFAVEWELERMATVDRNIMRLALFEILYSDNVPEAVATNEAIELAKSYGSEESARFTNGILGNIIKHLPEIKKKVAKTEE
ncbi:MAG: transcription antitermination factor NusB, partial [Bacillota bacterium]